MADSTSEARAGCAGGGFGGSKRSQLRGDALPPHSVSTLYVSSGLRFKLRFKPELLALLAWSFVKPVLSDRGLSHVTDPCGSHRADRPDVYLVTCLVTCHHVMLT